MPVIMIATKTATDRDKTPFVRAVAFRSATANERLPSRMSAGTHASAHSPVRLKIPPIPHRSTTPGIKVIAARALSPTDMFMAAYARSGLAVFAAITCVTPANTPSPTPAAPRPIHRTGSCWLTAHSMLAHSRQSAPKTPSPRAEYRKISLIMHRLLIAAQRNSTPMIQEVPTLETRCCSTSKSSQNGVIRIGSWVRAAPAHIAAEYQESPSGCGAGAWKLADTSQFRPINLRQQLAARLGDHYRVDTQHQILTFFFRGAEYSEERSRLQNPFIVICAFGGQR